MADADGGRQKSGQGGHGVKQIPDQDLGDGIPEACCTEDVGRSTVYPEIRCLDLAFVIANTLSAAPRTR